MDLPICGFNALKSDFGQMKVSRQQIKYFVGETLTDTGETRECEINYLDRNGKIDSNFQFRNWKWCRF